MAHEGRGNRESQLTSIEFHGDISPVAGSIEHYRSAVIHAAVRAAEGEASACFRPYEVRDYVELDDQIALMPGHVKFEALLH
ncbi:MAG: hypothetical protein JKY61_01995 [Planctomycetes bacterium]|nr:hypothetical protein [Planctomycetota bacterium]